MTHDELNEIAKRWLLRPESGKGPGCKVAFVEVGALGDTERADAWGYRWGHGACSVLVESKVSRSDFLADRKKPHRQAGGLGDYRYYICPEGLITIGDLPERWGLLWVNKRGHVKLMAGHVCCHVAGGYGSTRELANLWRHDCDIDIERGLLAYMVARVGDPDAFLQEQRQYLGTNRRLIQQLESERRDSRSQSAEISRLKFYLHELGWSDPQQNTRFAIPRAVGGKQ
ncbi:adenylosuccinate synthase [Dickeya solani]|uniref:Adenylosuccinate synthase n=1 Tax=Dickeya solani TaxID=1089444 RepID=A0ABU4EL53_9GAMM|nr:adenylosuccinate synthase [Dickeya solani]MCA6998195.1 adenylosuccinate synthase [Dickeya solani]MDV6997174.1 adenylosuccinate synthase [Dickeya solani]MDV7004485.1 adenylosuccinate synthase [Dickeya solani]MDV7040353.1 adenylosuccinate synthase [Dickeya solani]MDV7044804.1 adenylosuccinate synthase [Dickeya solani]